MESKITDVSATDHFGDLVDLLNETPTWVDLHTSKSIPREFVSFLKEVRIQNVTSSRPPVKFIVHDFYRETSRALKSHPRLIINSARQMGTTTMLMSYVLWSVLTKAEFKILVVSERLTGAIDLRERTFWLYDLLAYAKAPLWETSQSKMHFANGSSVEFVNASTVNSTSFHRIDLLVADNASYYAHDFNLNGITPRLDEKAQVVLAGSPNGTSGLFWNTWADDKEFAKVKFTWRDHPSKTQHWADHYRDLIGDRAFRQEFEGEFLAH